MSPCRGRGRATQVAVVAAVAAALQGCSHAPVRAPGTDAAGHVAAHRPAPVAAQGVQVLGPTGRLPLPARQALLQRLAREDGDPMRRHLAAMSTEPNVQLTTGNAARLLADGPDTFAAMFDAIGQARQSVLVETYIVDDAAIAQRLADLLIAKRKAGLEVALLYDAVGSIATDASYFDRLRAADVAVCAYNPLFGERPGSAPQSVGERNHRKVLVVDRRIGFTGGINVSAVYASGSLPRRWGRRAATPLAADGWRDTQVELRGPAAAVLDDLVRSTWARQACQPALQAEPPPRLPPAAGQQVVRIVPATPDQAYSPIYTTLLTAIDTAVRSVHITMAYFAPGDEMVDALTEAARRGVDVQLVLPSHSDFSPVLHAGRSHYTRLLAAGVRVHELQGAMLHAKTAVIDGVMSSVGSSNLDYRSFVGNHELNAVVLDDAFGRQMEAMFNRDVQASQEITATAWRDRPVWQKAREAAARWLEAWW